jgi:CRP-like cAMP-binding protein
LGNEEYFGEYGILKEETRCLSAKCRDFTEVYIITKKDLEEVSENCIEAAREI